MAVGFVLLLVTLAFLAFASFSDMRTREVADELSLGLFAAALAIRLLYSVWSTDPAFFLVPFAVSCGFLIFGLVMYGLKQWGGGDLLLLVGLGAAFGTLPADLAQAFPRRAAAAASLMPFWLGFIVNILVVGSAYGLLWILYYFLTRPSLKKVFVQQVRKNWLILSITLAISLISLKLVGIAGSFLNISLFLIILLIMLSKSVESDIFVKKISPGDLRVEDWLVKDVTARGRVIASASSPGLTKTDIAAIKHAFSAGTLDGREIVVKEGIPFVPVFPLALVLTVAFGDPITLLLLRIYGF